MTGAPTLEGLSQLTGVAVLTLRQCVVRKDDELSALTGLRRLRLDACQADELSRLSELPNLLSVTLTLMPLDGIEFLDAVSKLAEVTLRGIGWPEAAHDELAEWLVRRRPAHQIAIVPPEVELATGATLRRAGLRLGALRLPGGECVVVEPGPSGRIRASKALFVSQAASKSAGDADTFFGELAARADTRESPLPSELPVVAERTNAKGVREWLGTDAAIVRRFPNQLFYRETRGQVEARASELGISFPEWWTQARMRLAMAVPELRTEVRFHRDTGMPSVWLNIGTHAAKSEPFDRLLTKEGLVCVAHDDDAGSVALVIDLRTPSDTILHRLDPHDLRGRSGRSAMQPVFTSYEAMLDAVSALRVRGRVQIDAQSSD